LKQGLLLEGHPKVEKNVPAADGHAQSEKVAPLQSPKRRMVEENVVRIGDQPKDGAEQPKKKSRKGCVYKKGVDREVQREQLRHQNNERSIPRKHILQLVKEELETLGKEQEKSFRIESEAITLLHSTAEQLVVEMLSLYNRAAMQAKRTTVLAKDIAYVRALSEVLNAHLSFVLREDAENCLKRINANASEESAAGGQDVD
jgi:histone H3/H4